MYDLAKLTVKSGKGGNGVVSFRREKFVPRGGPDGGDGGKGGDVIVRVKRNLNTLQYLAGINVIVADDGDNGSKQNKIGKGAEDKYIDVPAGTIVWNISTDNQKTMLADLTPTDTNPDPEVIVVRGGKGGRGNTQFKSSVNQAPKRAEDGKPSMEQLIELEVKLIADIGLVGFPSSGKSTLINKLAGTKAKTAQYHFTTLSPNLGVMRFRDQEIVIADIPGLIEGASKGKGLGDDFLRHIERTKVLVHLIDGEKVLTEGKEVIAKDYKAIRKELEDYSQTLLDKPEIVVLNKVDLLPENFGSFLEKLPKFNNILGISALSGIGIDELKDEIFKKLQAFPTDNTLIDATKFVPTFTIDSLPNRRMVFNRKVDRDGLAALAIIEEQKIKDQQEDTKEPLV